MLDFVDLKVSGAGSVFREYSQTQERNCIGKDHLLIVTQLYTD